MIPSHWRHLEEALEVLRKAGINGKVKPGRKHPIIFWWSRNGTYYERAAPGSPSDYRSIKNTVADIRRVLIADGDIARENFTLNEERLFASQERRNKQERARLVAKMQQAREEYKQDMERLRLLMAQGNATGMALDRTG